MSSAQNESANYVRYHTEMDRREKPWFLNRSLTIPVDSRRNDETSSRLKLSFDEIRFPFTNITTYSLGSECRYL